MQLEGCGSACVGFVAHERLVVAHSINVVVPIPAGTAVVAEADHVAAEDGTRLLLARRAHGVLQVGVHLYLF